MSERKVISRVRVHPTQLGGSGLVRVPGDKSISQRAAIFAGLAHGVSRIRGYLRSEDCMNTLAGMQQLGVGVEEDGDVLLITGTGGALKQPQQDLWMGNSGTGTRLLTGLLAGYPLDVVLRGDESLNARPMARVRNPLVQMGAQIILTGERGTAPIRVRGGGLQGITYEMPMASAQVKSCILLATLHADGRSCIVEPLPSRDHTERFLEWLGVPIAYGNCRIEMAGAGSAGPDLDAFELQVPGDFSSAAFFLAVAALQPGFSLTVDSVGLNPGRSAMLDVLRAMGVDWTLLPDAAAGAEPAGRVTCRGGTLKATEISGPCIPSLIDEIPLLSVVAACADGVTRIADAQELRHKESDRIAVMAGVLRQMGIAVEERPDGLDVQGGAPIRGGCRIDCRGDHRIAMSTAVLALRADEAVEIDGVACVATSYPEFWNDLKAIGVEVDECF